MSDKRKGATRRTFLRTAGGAAAAITTSQVMGRVLGANDRIRFGLVGCGGRGSFHLQEIRKLRDAGEKVDVVAVCDTYRPRMAKRAKDWGAKQFMSHKDLLVDGDVDAVCIATPDHIHGYQAIDAIEAGKDVYCEKPVTHWRQFELTKRMTEVVNASDCIFQVGTQGLSDSAWHQAKEMVDKGMIGRPIHAECGYFRVGDWGERGMPIDDPDARPGPDLDWEAFLGDSPKRAFDVSRYFRWRMYEDYSGGPGTDLFPHSLTPVVYAMSLGMPATAVGTGGKFRYDEREVPDTFNMLVDYPEKVTVAVLGTQGNDFCGASGRASVSRAPTLRGWEGTLTFESHREEIVFSPTQRPPEDRKRFKITRGESQARYWQSFFEACRTRKQPVGTADLAFRVQTAIQMAMLAHRNGSMARFDAKKQAIIV